MSSCGFQNKIQINMKKLFILIMTVAAFAACNKEAAVETPQGDAIAFGDAFVDNSTKAIYETANDLTGFTVWGSVADVALYGTEGATVTRDSKALGTAWTCSVTRYWTPSSTFNFAAIANGTGTDCVNGIPTKISYTLNGEDPADLVYGTATATTDANSVPVSGVNDSKVVAFTLNHLLTRLQVSFQNLIPEAAYTYKVTDVTITTWDQGIYTIGAATPWSRTGTATTSLPYSEITSLAYNTVTSSGAQLIIPGSSVTLSFNYVLSLNGTEIYKTTTPISKTIVNDFLEGNSYNIDVQLKAGNQIDFSVSETDGLAGWGNGGSSNVQL